MVDITRQGPDTHGGDFFTVFLVTYILHSRQSGGRRIKTFDLARDFLARSDAMRTQPEDHRPFQRAPPQDHHSSGFVTQLSIADEALETQGENDTCSQVAAVKRQCKNLSKSENMLDIVAKKNQ
ncbi:uncharacterized protein LOC143030676 isoform X2 [Oratosquilla oratoria]|uniref:uncharacterized protein LOC143030676 isoform X2 n=1 Tax=Oratosquilla oratoria TaxID=337810 RepID=UPI003F761C07